MTEDMVRRKARREDDQALLAEAAPILSDAATAGLKKEQPQRSMSSSSRAKMGGWRSRFFGGGNQNGSNTRVRSTSAPRSQQRQQEVPSGRSSRAPQNEQQTGASRSSIRNETPLHHPSIRGLSQEQQHQRGGTIYSNLPSSEQSTHRHRHGTIAASQLIGNSNSNRGTAPSPLVMQILKRPFGRQAVRPQDQTVRGHKLFIIKLPCKVHF